MCSFADLEVGQWETVVRMRTQIAAANSYDDTYRTDLDRNGYRRAFCST